MPAGLPDKRGPPSSSGGSPQKKKTRAERRKSATHSPAWRYGNSIKKLANQLRNPAYMRTEVAEIHQPLMDFYGFLKNRTSSFNGSERYLAALVEVIDLTGGFIDLINQVVDRTPAAGDTAPPNRDHWPFIVRERYLPMVNFGRSLRSTCYLAHEDLQIMRMHSAISTLRHHIALHASIAKKIKSKRPEEQSEEKALRLKVHLLITTEQLDMSSKDVDALELDKLRTIVENNKERLDCDIFWLDDLHKNHHCRTCTDNPTGSSGKYPSPSDGSGTPQIPGLFPTGPISVNDLNQHRFRYITGGTTCGLTNYPGTETPELAFFTYFPDFHSLSPEHAARMERLAYLIHLGAYYSSECKTNQAQQALPEELREYLNFGGGHGTENRHKGGEMKVLGNRKARDSKPFGMYAVPSRFKGNKRPDYLEFQKECVPEIATILNLIFQGSYSSVVAERARQFGKEFNLPPLGAISIDEITWNPSMGCNLSISCNNFSNEAHLDKDGYRYVFSVYVFVDRATGELVTDAKRIANCMKGGYLVWPDLHLALKIVHCSGVVLLFWRGTHERHSTILSETTDNSVIRYGTSLQVNKKVFNSVQRYHERLEELERWELNGGPGECPDFPELPTDLNDLCVSHK
ncbi:hypothetical protein FRC08_004773 [Ceratobasidium sp. 394]|nr:hypothetical protein FRC08_004773 [Ceratobasidium sp. 394]